MGSWCSTEVTAGVEATKPLERAPTPLGPGIADVSKLLGTSLLLLSPVSKKQIINEDSSKRKTIDQEVRPNFDYIQILL